MDTTAQTLRNAGAPAGRRRGLRVPAGSRVNSVRYLLATGIFSLLVAGCADTNKGPTTRPMTADERQKKALNDPFGYGGDNETYDVSGGDTKTLDKKALKRDLDSFFNP